MSPSSALVFTGKVNTKTGCKLVLLNSVNERLHIIGFF